MPSSFSQIFTLTVSANDDELECDFRREGPVDLDALAHGLTFLLAHLVKRVGAEKASAIVDDLFADHVPNMQIELRYDN